MKVTAELSIIPVGTGLSFSESIAKCEHVLKDKGLKIQLHSEGTDIEGDLETLLDSIKNCIETVHKSGVPRIITDIKISSRVDREQTMNDRIKSVQSKI